ncbi:MAG TPA: DUF5666 domain-containing protein [Vicinamibacterales bacterium]|nr:DUF5666 domain-containing protein [Vicinamibacterales bacterium]
MPRFLIITLAAAALCGGCGSKSSAPTAPSSITTASGATITGTVQGAAATASVAAVRGASLTGVTVTVVGTSISSSLDGSGRFSLLNVPAGAVQLQFSGGGANATVSLNPVQPLQTVDLVVVVAGSSATIDSDVRSGAGEAELEGRVESLPPTMPALTFKAAGRTVKTDSSTRFVDGSATRAFGDLTIGMRVHVKGTMTGDTLVATLVEMQNSTAVPVEVNGVVDSLTGGASAFQFKIGSSLVKGDSQTSFFGDGDTPDTFADLKNGERVEVKGEQRDGFVYAVRIHINGDSTTPPEDTSASIHGTLNSIGGAKPNLTLRVDTTTVRTSASTDVKRRGDTQSLDNLKVGQSLHVVGTRQSDGTIDARLIEIDDDAVGGEFEIEGSIGGLHGACPAIQFNVNGFAISTGSSTTFDGAGCSALKSGDQVDVKGTRLADGSIAATTVRKT